MRRHKFRVLFTDFSRNFGIFSKFFYPLTATYLTPELKTNSYELKVMADASHF
jgi:hypothetical protein